MPTVWNKCFLLPVSTLSLGGCPPVWLGKGSALGAGGSHAGAVPIQSDAGTLSSRQAGGGGTLAQCPPLPLSLSAQHTHPPQRPKEDPAKKPAAAPLTPKQEPVEEEPPPPASKASESSSSSSEDEEPPSSPELRKSKRSRFQHKAGGPGRSRSNGWTCGICHSWFPERDEYVVHMKKIHGKVSGLPTPPRPGGGNRPPPSTASLGDRRKFPPGPPDEQI